MKYKDYIKIHENNKKKLTIDLEFPYEDPYKTGSYDNLEDFCLDWMREFIENNNFLIKNNITTELELLDLLDWIIDHKLIKLLLPKSIRSYYSVDLKERIMNIYKNEMNKLNLKYIE